MKIMMVGNKYSGNPNIAQISKEKSTGPISKMGKLRSSMNALKSGEHSKELDKTIEELGIKFKKASDALSLKQSFVTLWKSKSGKEINEIERLEEAIAVLEADTSIRVMRKLEKGIPLDEDDVKIIRLLKECLSASHELKFGKKQIHAHLGYKDIRDMMFPNENPRSK